MRTHSRNLIILKTGDKIPSLATTTGDYEHWIAAGMEWPLAATRVVDPRSGDALPRLPALQGVVITGSGSMVSHREPWMRSTEAWLAEVVAAGVPVLGICFGHQLLAQALGGHVDDNPAGTEVGTVTIQLSDGIGPDALFATMPRRFPAQVSHRQSVLQLPPGARRLGNSEREAHQAVAFGPSAWGVQFHPEFDANIIGHFITYHAANVSAAGDDLETLRQNTRPTPESRSLLTRFAELVRDAPTP